MNNQISPWQQGKLADVALIVSGGTPSRNVPEYWAPAVINWATPTDITKEQSIYLTRTAEKISEIGLKNSSANLLPTGSVLMTSRATLGYSKITMEPTCTNQGFKSLVPKPNQDGLFIKYWMEFKKRQYADLGTGTTFMEVNKRDTENFPIPLLPFGEQRRIAEILSTVDEQIDSLNKKIQKGVYLEDALTQRLIGEKPTATFRDYIQIRPPLTCLGQDEDLVAFLPMECLGEDGTIQTLFKRRWSQVKQGFTAFQGGDTLVAKITPCFENGKGAFIPENISRGAGSTEYHVLRANSGVSPRWVYWITRARLFRTQGAGLMEGSAGQQRVPKDFVERFLVRNPFEKDISTTLIALDENQTILTASRTEVGKLNSVKSALMTDLLTGKVRVTR